MPDNSSVGSENIHEGNIDRHDQRVHVHIIIKNSGIIVQFFNNITGKIGCTKNEYNINH